jgi:hypothetical protein
MTGTITVTIWHNVTHDDAGRRTGPLGFTPGDQMVKVFTYQAEPRGRPPGEIAEHAFAAFNGAPPDDEAAGLARQYRAGALRSVSVGDMVVAGEAALIVARAGFVPLPGNFTPVHVHEHGTHPIG